jgi:hypothetical protein|tara:strand:+ start:25 stop:534 length:510 start_codon:yes stop_codon:yes gene_type:complete
MALEQELPGIGQNELFDRAFDWEPKYTNRFIMYIGDIPTYIIKAAARPSLTNGEIVLDHINVERKLKGKTRWQDVSITLYDPIVPSGAQAVMEWVRLHHESLTGRDGYSTQYKKDIRFNSLSPTGEIIEEWLLKGAFIADSNFGQMDWATEDSVQIELTLKYDYAVLEF